MRLKKFQIVARVGEFVQFDTVNKQTEVDKLLAEFKALKAKDGLEKRIEVFELNDHGTYQLVFENFEKPERIIGFGRW